MKKKQATKVHCNPKMYKFWTLNGYQTFKTTSIDMKIITTITKLQENVTQQVLLKTNIEWRTLKVVAIKLNLWTLNGSQKINKSCIDLMVLPHKQEESTNFATSFIKFGHWMQKLWHFELDFQTMWWHFWSPRALTPNYVGKLLGKLLVTWGP